MAARSPGPSDTRFLSKEVLNETLNLAFHRLNRDRAHVMREYDDGVWKKALQGEAWLRAGSLEEYLTTQDVRDRVAKIEGRLVSNPDVRLLPVPNPDDPGDHHDDAQAM